MHAILDKAQEILGPAVRVEEHRGWAIFWCPFHADDARAGQGGRPNFGVKIHSPEGYWKCLRCGVAGPSLTALQRKLGVSPPQPTAPQPKIQARFFGLDEALAEGRAALLRSPAWHCTG